jgi:hypothetical protein
MRNKAPFGVDITSFAEVSEIRDVLMLSGIFGHSFLSFGEFLRFSKCCRHVVTSAFVDHRQ